jgi:hypothetical protein
MIRRKVIPRLRVRGARRAEYVDSASPADACNLAVEQPVFLPDGRSGRRRTGSGCRKSRSSHLDRSLHRERSVSSRRGYGRYGNRAYCGRWYRRHFGRIADAGGIADRAVKSARIRRPRRNAAHAGILGRRSPGSGQKTQDRKGQERRSADHPSAREDRNKLRAFHGSVILSRLAISTGTTWKAGPKFPRRAEVLAPCAANPLCARSVIC